MCIEKNFSLNKYSWAFRTNDPHEHINVMLLLLQNYLYYNFLIKLPEEMLEQSLSIRRTVPISTEQINSFYFTLLNLLKKEQKKNKWSEDPKARQSYM